jgi:hypothetical protein
VRVLQCIDRAKPYWATTFLPHSSTTPWGRAVFSNDDTELGFCPGSCSDGYHVYGQTLRYPGLLLYEANSPQASWYTSLALEEIAAAKTKG